MLFGTGFTCNNYHTGMHTIIICVICCSVETVNRASNGQQKQLIGVVQTRLDKVRLDCTVFKKFKINHHHTVVVVVVVV